MIRMATALLATSVGAQADLPSPLFCNTVAICETAESCTAPDTDPHFVLRRTEGEWVMQYSARGSDTWVIAGDTAEDIIATAPEGARVAVIAAGISEDGAVLLHQHMLEPLAISAAFERHECRTSDGHRP